MPKTTNAKGRTFEKLGFSAPAGLLAAIDAAAAETGHNRSQFIVQAVREKIKRLRRSSPQPPA